MAEQKPLEPIDPKWAEEEGPRKGKEAPRDDSVESLNTGWIHLPPAESSELPGAMEFKTSSPEDLSSLSGEDRMKLLDSAPEDYPRVRWLMLTLVVTGLAGAAVWIILEVIREIEVGRSEIARGLITTTFTIGTIGIALILVITVLMGGVNAYAARVRFREGKEVLTLLLGILGTVVGFYFGNSNNATENLGISVSSIQVSDLEPVVGQSFKIRAEVTGTRPPLTYEIQFSIPEIETISGQSDTEYIEETIPLSEVTSAKELRFELIVTDQQGHRTTARRTVSLKAPPATSNSNGQSTNQSAEVPI